MSRSAPSTGSSYPPDTGLSQLSFNNITHAQVRAHHDQPQYTSKETAPEDRPFFDARRGAGFSYGRRQYPRAMAWLPALGVSLCTAGIVAGLLTWLLTRRVHDHLPSEDAQFRGALVALEGSSHPTKNSDGTTNVDTILYGLTVSTIASHFVSFTTPIVIAVFALRLAASWLHAQQSHLLVSMPTAAQYGLIMKLYASPGLMAIFETGQYLLKRKGQRASLAPLLFWGTSVATLVLVVSYAVSGADVWLHATSVAFLHSELRPIPQNELPMLGCIVDLSTCPGPAVALKLPNNNPASNYSNCQHFDVVSATAGITRWGNSSLINEGLAALHNQSSGFQVVTVSDMAMLVPPTQPTDVVNAGFDTFGLTAQCTPVTGCDVDDVEEHPNTVLFCGSFNPPISMELPQDLFFGNITQYNFSGSAVLDIATNGSVNQGYPLDAVLNPTGALLSFSWAVPEGSVAFPSDDNAPGWYRTTRATDLTDFAFYIAVCKLTMYDVPATYSSTDTAVQVNHAFDVRSDPTLTDFNTTSALLAALDITYQQDLVDFLQETLTPYLNVSTDTFNAILSGNMSLGMLALASPLLAPTLALNGSVVQQRGASRYKLAPLCTLVALLCVYALLAAVLGVSAAFVSSRKVIVERAPAVNWHSPPGEDKTWTEAELVHLRLTNSLTAVADRFADPGQQGLQFETSPLDMFREGPDADRLCVASQDEDGLEGTSSLFRRKQGSTYTPEDFDPKMLYTQSLN